MTDLIAEFCDFHHTYNNISAVRRRRQLRQLRALEAHMGRPIVEITAADLRAYLTTLVERGLTPNTVQFYLNTLRGFIRWLWNRRLIDAETWMDLHAVRPPRGATDRGTPHPYTRIEIQRFWQEYDEHYALDDRTEFFLGRWRDGRSRFHRIERYARRLQADAIVRLALHGGLRRVEIFRLELHDIRPGGEYLVVRGARKNPRAEIRERPVPWLTDELREAVRTWLAFRDELEPTHDRPWLRLRAPDPAAPAGIDGFSSTMFGRWEFRRLRHTFATEALRARMEIQDLQRVMGHADVHQTLAYAKLVNSDIVKRAAEVRPGFSRALGHTTEEAA